jgi:hypothetical protein
MANILKQHKVCHGHDVLLKVAGTPITLTFEKEPTEIELMEAMILLEENKLAKIDIGGEEEINVREI